VEYVREQSGRPQLPITGSAHKATVVRDPSTATVLASLDMAAEGGGAALLDRRHDLEVLKAQVPGMDGPIGGAGGPEDVGDLKRRAHRLIRQVVPDPRQRYAVCLAG
jgi:hypothetical protein